MRLRDGQPDTAASAPRIPDDRCGPEPGNALAAPIIVDNELQYIISLVAVEQTDMPQDAIIAMLLTIKQSLEGYLHQYTRIKAQEAILDATPFAVYHVMAGD